MRRYTGTIQIDSVNFWAWVQECTKNYDTRYESVVFDNSWNPHDILLIVNHEKQHHVFIPYADFWSWVIEEWSPNPADEIEFNTPVWNESHLGINIEFAAGTEHPSMWGEKPSWMQK